MGKWGAPENRGGCDIFVLALGKFAEEDGIGLALSRGAPRECRGSAKRGWTMKQWRDLCAVAMLGLVIGTASQAWSAAVDETTPGVRPSVDLNAPTGDYPFDVEMIVQNWVLCASLPSAEEIVAARAKSAVEARKVFGALSAAKSCGSFTELKVILQKAVYASAPEAGYDARVFGGLVSFSGNWAAGYLVSGGLAD
jgi:hypothetical protein